MEASNQQLSQAKDKEKQMEQRARGDQKAREEAVRKFEEEKRSREQAETAWKRKEENLKRKYEGELQKEREKVQALEKEVGKLKQAVGQSVLGSPPKRKGEGEGGSQQNSQNSENFKANASDNDDYYGGRCVVCKNDAVGIIFIPCGHTEICSSCNEIQQREGKNHCLRCNSKIKERVHLIGTVL